ncbi:DNA-processing protein DprA [Clostridium celatum]|uniref:DNA-processing protein DprA n=1 Tax=Clostridium celatum TaxID=36834 RepID=UPI001897830E|nr:DNA-processing protein DprA [Clostridium celatum]MCE9653862.1 DNA-processing protein DprA [Clostridium celatum]MDU3722414.1 DNA-processing protein DprA [Clostridium celatum]MDU6296920.1 DNA-processing protein DprA [Clostridium celatum]MDY3361845.1 DNA-processing protein DprA [Clostridium celatum]
MNSYQIWLITNEITNACKIDLINKYNNEENIYNNIDNIIRNEEFKKYNLNKLKEYSLDKEEELKIELLKEDIKYVTYSDEKYPIKLREINNPPYVLFYKGDIELLNFNMAAIVGSRKNSMYGKEVTKVIVSELKKINFGVISGVAYGIDSIAHREILRLNGKTIGILGCGIDIIYPKINRDLYTNIIKDGLLISEFLPGTKPLSYNFPRRNRIISGLSEGVIVIEASNKSGSLITVNYALEQNKNVMAVPGSIFNEGSKGCNLLIRDGAFPFLEREDLYSFFNITKVKENNIGKNSIENQLLNVIQKEPIHIDKIIESVKVDRIALFELLFELQNKNEIICLPGNYYAKIS